MSELGQTRSFDGVDRMSAYPKAEIAAPFYEYTASPVVIHAEGKAHAQRCPQLPQLVLEKVAQ
jgi:hypothetical protein